VVSADRRGVHEAAIENSAIAQAIIHFMKERSHWNGTPTIISNLKEFDIKIRSVDDSTTKHRTICIEKGVTQSANNGDKEIVKSSIPSIRRYDVENRTQNASDIGIDILDRIGIGIDATKTPIPQDIQNRTQNGSSINSIDDIDICLRSVSGYTFAPRIENPSSRLSCNHCAYEACDVQEYDHHTITKHPRKAGYPDKNGRTG
jgi:hypothetical protein